MTRLGCQWDWQPIAALPSPVAEIKRGWGQHALPRMNPGHDAECPAKWAGSIRRVEKKALRNPVCIGYDCK